MTKKRGALAMHWFVGILVTLSSLSLSAQTGSQNPSPMTDTTRPHPRISRTEVPGRRIELGVLKGARLFAGSKVKPEKPAPLIIHFHGAPWLIEYHTARALPKAVLITVQLGAGSRAYGSPFENPETFRAMIDQAGRELGNKRGWSSITLTGFSAGYGAIRAILRDEDNFDRVNNVLLLDGIHASYSPEETARGQDKKVNAADLDSFVKFAREAVAGRRSFVITHSEIFPGTYASTTECADYLLAELGVKRRPKLLNGPIGMQQLSVVDAKGFHVRGYAGNTAPDHVDFLHAAPVWFKLLDIE